MRGIVLLLKEKLFSYYWVLPVGIIFIPLVSDWLTPEKKIETTFVLISGIFALMFFVQKQKLEEAGFFQSIFGRFNEKYDKLNDDLCSACEAAVLNDDQKKTLVDYFNLCAEEYFLYCQGYIPLCVWSSWKAGMFQYWRSPQIQAFWKKELKTNSYYGFNPELEFKSYTSLEVKSKKAS